MQRSGIPDLTAPNPVFRCAAYGLQVAIVHLKVAETIDTVLEIKTKPRVERRNVAKGFATYGGLSRPKM